MYKTLKGMALQIVKAALISVTVLFFCITLLAVIVHVANLSATVLHPAIQVIKPFALLCGILCAVKEERGALKGFLSGVAAVLLMLLVLSAWQKGAYRLPDAILDLVVLGVFGAILGVFTVRIKNR